MSDFAAFMKAAGHILERFDKELNMLHDLLEDADLDSDRADDARLKVGKVQFAYADAKRAILSIKEEDMVSEDEEEEDDDEEEEDETESI